jgi:predicted ATPase/DNA-binding SARP family transcriptional activator
MEATMPRASHQYHLYLLGAFRIEKNSRAIRFPTRKVESLLAYLVLFPKAHSREKLAALFWGDSTDEQARHSLRTALATIRKKLGDVLLADRETVQLNPDTSIWADVREFEKIGDWRLEISGSSISNLQSLLSLYRGDLLTDFYDDWIFPERERLRRLYLDTLLAVVQRFRSTSQYERAVECARKILVTDPANEKAHQHLMFCHAAMGNRSTALKQYDECARLLHDELGVEPSSETDALRERIQAELTGAKSPEALMTNLPHPLTSFIGRERESAEIRQRLETSRLVTLVGAGGCGKTRLAIQVASDLAAAQRFKHGAWWVDLAPLNDSALVATVVATTFHLRESPPTPLTSILIEYLREKEILLMLDNCEHLGDSCARLTQTLLTACPRLHILATSRSPLGITGEVAWKVPSMSTPDPENTPSLDLMPQFDAVRLFAERATAVAANWKLKDHASAVVRICTRLDGIPLALELAAARLKVLSAEQIATRLDDCFKILTVGNHMALPRHRTLRATMDWSFDLLSDEERKLFRRLSVFAGGFSLEAVEAVCSEQSAVNSKQSTDYCSPFTVHCSLLNLLTSLIDKSLVGVEQKGNAMRYRLLETVRQYAREKLLEANEFEAYCARHRDWFLQLAEQAEPKLRSGEQMEWFERLELEMENLRAALAWSLEQSDNESTERAMRLLKTEWLAAGTDVVHGGYARRRGELLLACSLFESALDHARRSGDRWMIGNALENIGLAVLDQGDDERAAAFLTEGLEFHREMGDKHQIANCLYGLGIAAWHRDDCPQADSLLKQSLTLRREIGDTRDVAVSIGALSRVAATGQRYERAARLLGAVDAQRGIAFERDRRAIDDDAKSLRAQIGEALFDKAHAEGRAMSLQQATEYALENVKNV